MRERELDDETRAAARGTLGARSAAVERHQLAHDRETNPAATRRRLGGAVQADVRLPHALSFVVRNSGAFVFDVDASPASNDLRADGDRLAGWLAGRAAARPLRPWWPGDIGAFAGLVVGATIVLGWLL